MKTELLKDLYSLLGNVPDDIKFDMCYWHVKTDCRTTCCAAGLAITKLQSWKDAGFYMVHFVGDYYPSLRREHYPSVGGYYALGIGLGLSGDDVHEIFSPGNYKPISGPITPKDVRERIAKLCPEVLV